MSGLAFISASSRSILESSRSEFLLWLGGIAGRGLAAAESIVKALREINGGREMRREGRSADGPFIGVQLRISASWDAETQVLLRSHDPLAN